jgi:CDP-glycerol glycerophosphotransferase
MFVVCGYRADINSFFGSRAILVNLWHGIPYKRIERDVTVGPLAILHRPRAAYSPVVKALACDTATPDFLVSPSSFVTETCLQSAFAIDASRCWDVGYPRNDHLRPGAPVLTSPALVQDAGRWHSLAAATVVGYFPTWRDNGHAVYQDAGFDLEQLARTVADIGGILIFKPHYNEPPPQLDVPGLVVLGADEDLHAYLGICDLLITDYSSVALDYALTGRPVLYFTPDLEEYSRTRGLYFAPDSVLLGPALSTGPEVLAAVRAWHDDPRPPSAAYAQIRRRFWQGYDFAACEAVVARVEAVLGAEVDGLMKERLIE